jgi:plasmid maintenance system antidote protein VapI
MHAEWLRKGLSKPGKSNRGLAEHLGVTEETVERLLAGKRVFKVIEVYQIAEYLEEPTPRAAPVVNRQRIK